MRRLFLLLLTCLPFFAQSQVSIEDFLLAVWDEPTLQSFSQQDRYLNTKPFRLAPIQQLQVRTESNQLDPQRQGYAVRLNPSNPWEMRRNNQYFKTYQEVLQLDRNRALKESLLERYNVIIGWLYFQEVNSLKLESKQTNEKLLSILEGQRYSDYFDADGYVKLKLDQVENTLAVEETNFEIDNQRRRVEALYESAKLKTIEWPATSVISVDKIEIVIDSLVKEQAALGEVAYREKQIDLATREWQLEKSNISVGFLQTQYERYRIDQGRRPWSVSMGLTIPIFNPNKGDMTKRKLDVMEAEGDYKKAKSEQDVGRDITYRKIKSLITRYHEINRMSLELNTGALANTLQQINKSNPASVVRIQGDVIKLKTMTVRLKQEIYRTYVEFLAYSELIQQTPLINYLSPKLQAIEK